MSINRKELEKNKIDMEYRFEAQKANIYLTLGTITVLGFIGALLIAGEKTLAIILGLGVFIAALILYFNAKRNLKEILKRLDKL